MKQVEVLEGQTLIDLAMQELGDASRLFELSDLNGMLPSDDLAAGQIISVPEPTEEKREIVKALKARKPATKNEIVEEQLKEGIGYWGIGTNFKVS
jgi:hypothetical protein